MGRSSGDIAIGGRPLARFLEPGVVA
jgi:hypothetical protein